MRCVFAVRRISALSTTIIGDPERVVGSERAMKRWIAAMENRVSAGRERVRRAKREWMGWMLTRSSSEK